MRVKVSLFKNELRVSYDERDVSSFLDGLKKAGYLVEYPKKGMYLTGMDVTCRLIGESHKKIRYFWDRVSKRTL